PTCSGLGATLEVDPELVVPDSGLSLLEGAIAPWSGPRVANHYQHVFAGLAENHGFDATLPWSELPVKARKLV
ncbi:hypothetical protein HJY41_15105, partial [Barnesiella sp. GGCC_0306]|nr:hypothetical protein [Barnesiella sp. GGCC_0306]